MATEADARAARAHPEAELVAAAGGSDGTRVKLCVTNVYNSSSSEVMSLETTNTVGDLKKLIEAAFASRPPPHQQRLIFRGKQCEEEQQLGYILRGVDLAVQHDLHLVVTQPAERTSTGTSDRALPDARHPPPQQQSPRPSVSSGVAPSVPGVTTGQPERIDLSAEQMRQLQWQYQQAMRENQHALQQHQQHHHFLSSQSMALTQQQQQLRQPPQYHSEVATVAATRALGGNMPGPAAGGAVRDVTGAPPVQFIPAAGLGEDRDAGRGNLVDPPRRAPDVGREARGLMKMVLQFTVVFLVFGIDADGIMLVFLAVGVLLTVMLKTGFLKEMLGGSQAGGGLWKKLCSAATVIGEGGGILMDSRFLVTSFVLSLFPKWKPVRSPEAIAAEAAEAAVAAAEVARVEAEAAQAALAAAEVARVEAEAAEAARVEAEAAEAARVEAEAAEAARVEAEAAEAARVEAEAAEAARVEAEAAEAAPAVAMEHAQQQAVNPELYAAAEREVEGLEVD